MAAHLTRIPFENISKLLYKKRLGLTDVPPIQTYLDGAQKYHFGGTCYSNNIHFYCLLASLGYEVKLCSADMAERDVHAFSLLTVEGHEYLMDVGYAAPFLEPLPRDLKTDYVLSLGRDSYVLKPQDTDGRSVLELYRSGVLRHGYLAKPEPREIADFRRVIANSFRKDATFLNVILVARFYRDRSVVIHNLNLIESSGEHYQIRTLCSWDEVAAAVQYYAGIPRELVAEVTADLKELQDAWSEPLLGGREPSPIG